MKTKTKKITLVIATVVLLAVCFCFGASAQDDGYGALVYENYYGETTIVGCADDYEGVVVIPETLGGATVTAIDSYAFNDCDEITGIVIPDTVTSIDDYAFYDCDSLEFIIFNSSAELNSYTIVYCPSLSSIYLSLNVDYVDEELTYYSNDGGLTVYYEGSVYDWDGRSMYLDFDRIVYNHAHKYDKKTSKATFATDGAVTKLCACGMQSKTTVPSVKTVSIPYTEYTYNGEAKNPTVTVKDREGNKLKKGTDYKVAYSSGRTAVGKYNVRITLMGKYAGEKVLSFKVLPGKTSAIATSSTSNSITLKWKAVKGAAGYRVYVYDKALGDYKKLTTTTEVKYTAKNLKGDTTYKFKVLAYGKKSGTTYWASKYTTVKETTKRAYEIKLNAESVSLYAGQSKAIKATTYPTGVTVKWKSSNTSVAKVSQKGTIVAVNGGTATITAYFTYGGKTYKDTCTVKVSKPSISLNTTSSSIGLYDALYLKATTKPSGATVKWTSSNTAVAKVSSKGTVVPVRTGSCTITASMTYGGKTYKATCAVRVYDQEPIEITYVDWTTNSVDGVEPEITIKNNTNKDIAEIEIDTAYRDAWGDPAYCEIRYDYTRTLIVSSGLPAKTTKTFYWGPAVYHWGVHRIDINTISILFADGTTAYLEPYVYWYDSYYYY